MYSSPSKTLGIKDFKEIVNIGDDHDQVSPKNYVVMVS